VKRVRSHYPEPEPFALRLTMLLVKTALGVILLAVGGVALANYRVMLHADGTVEFARKPEWTLVDSFRFLPDDGAPAPGPSVAAVVVSPPPTPFDIKSAPPPAPLPPAPSIAQRAPAPAPVMTPAPAPSPVMVAAARARVSPKPAPVRPPIVDDEEAGDDAVGAVLSTVRPASTGADECRRIRRSLAEAVTRLESDHPGTRVGELKVFELIQQGYLDQLESCPAQGNFVLQRRARHPEVRCTIHGL